MADAGTRAADKAQAEIEKRLQRIYKQAQKEIDGKLKDFTKKFKAKDAVMQKKLKTGEITLAQYAQWQQGQVFIGKQWQDKRDSIAATLLHANQQANAIVEGKKRAVFGENATFQAYELENGLHQDLSFTVYDSATVTKLLRDQPELLPRKVVNGKKDRAWNKAKIANAVTQGIIQGESIDDIAKRIAQQTSSQDMGAMVRYARTAMTGAQNAGRIEAMHDAQDMGINVQKRWIATLDSKTRDSHAMLDGQTAEVNKPFQSELGPIMFPGDPSAAPANVYNCRCTLGYVYPEYAHAGTQRRDNETQEVIPDMTYSEWKAAKGANTKTEIYNAKEELNEATNQVVLNNANKVFTGIWQEDVTYADYEEKYNSGSIDRKREYFNKRMEWARQNGDTDTEEKFKKLLQELDEFEKNGPLNAYLLAQREAALNKFQSLLPKPEVKGPFGPEAYTQARKDAALWGTKKEVDDALRTRTGEVWRAATQAERNAIYDYTTSFSKFNEPLRGIEYGTSRYIGVGKTDLDAGYKHNGQQLNDMTSIIGKCTYDQDVWLQRGVGAAGMDKFFQVDEQILRYGTEQELQSALLGKNVTEYGFMSCATAKGEGFSHNPIILNIYAPKGTKMMYAEPFSAYGNGDRLSWDGLSKQRTFGGEFETIIEQGTVFKVTKVEKTGGRIFIDLDVVEQDNVQLWKP